MFQGTGACMGRRKYVLIVDDCQQDRMAVADVLRSDYDILEACNGKQALEILSRIFGDVSEAEGVQLSSGCGVYDRRRPGERAEESGARCMGFCFEEIQPRDHETARRKRHREKQGAVSGI